MTNKLILWISVFIFNLAMVNAQTGLFDGGISSTFATAGITIVIVILVFKEVFKRMFRKNAK